MILKASSTERSVSTDSVRKSGLSSTCQPSGPNWCLQVKVLRRTARIYVLDPAHRVVTRPSGPFAFRLTPGNEIEPNESPIEAAPEPTSDLSHHIQPVLLDQRK